MIKDDEVKYNGLTLKHHNDDIITNTAPIKLANNPNSIRIKNILSRLPCVGELFFATASACFVIERIVFNCPFLTDLELSNAPRVPRSGATDLKPQIGHSILTSVKTDLSGNCLESF